MKLHDQIRVAARPEAIWPYLANPELIPRWNPKLVAVEHRGHGEVVTGDRFTARYRLRSNREGVRCEVLVRYADPPSAVGYEHTVDQDRRRCRVTESYRLEAL